MSDKKTKNSEKTSIVDINSLIPENIKNETALRTYILKVVSGDNIGKIFTLENNNTVVGRGDECDIRLFSKSISRKHASFILNDDNTLTLMDNNSTNGTFVNGFRVNSVLLKQHDMLRFGHSLELEVLDEASYMRELDSSGEDLSKDKLTGVYSRDSFLEEMNIKYVESLKHFSKIALILVEIDNMNSIFKNYGELNSICVLKKFVCRIKKGLRKRDSIGRYAYSQFSVLLADCGCEEGKEVAERVRKLFYKKPFSCNDDLINVTVSIGVSTMDDEAVFTGNDLLINSEKKLAEAVEKGGNTVT
ncbi:MAG: diguanylate cyclase [bacterium]